MIYETLTNQTEGEGTTETEGEENEKEGEETPEAPKTDEEL